MKKNIYLMYTIAFLQGLVFYGPIATLYREARGLSVFQITLIESISLFLCKCFYYYVGNGWLSTIIKTDIKAL